MSEGLSLIARHPATLEEISKYLNCTAERAARLLKALLEGGEVERHSHRGRIYYAAAAACDATSREEFAHASAAARAQAVKNESEAIFLRKRAELNE